MKKRKTTDMALIIMLTLIAISISFAFKTTTAQAVELLIMDEDTLSSSLAVISEISNNSPNCGGGDKSKCVNDNLATLYYREILFTQEVDITPYSGLQLPTGQLNAERTSGDVGLARFTKPDPQLSNQNGASFSKCDFIYARGAASNDNNLDKVDQVLELGEPEIYALLGKTVCGVAIKSDFSIDYVKNETNIRGSTRGITAFIVTSVDAHPSGPPQLPLITIHLLPSSQVRYVCDRACFPDLPQH